MNRRAYIIFTREPVPGKTKTRLMPYYSPEQCRDIHCAFLEDFRDMSRDVDADIFVYYYSENGEYPIVRDIFGDDVAYHEQEGSDIGYKMYNAIKDVLSLGYYSCVLTGTDIPKLRAESVNYALDSLEDYDCVVGRTADGGYHLIGMKVAISEPFHLEEYASESVYENTMDAITSMGYSVLAVDEYSDIDTPTDIREFMRAMRYDSRLRKSHTGRFIDANAKVSVIVPVYNEEKTVIDLQVQLKKNATDAEVIFVDGGSTDKTADLISPSFKLIMSDKGRACQMNEGAKASSGDILFFLHCDSRVPDDFINQIRKVMEKHDYGCFGVRFDSQHFFMWTNRIISNFRAWRRGIPFGDQGIFIDRGLFEEIGGFEEIPIMEDVEFSTTLRKKGYMPGKTKSRITTSTRRYDGKWYQVMITEYKMWSFRRKYRRGKDVNEIAKEYGDVR